MISDERLEESINGDILFTDEQRAMAKELQAYRQAFSEPFGHMNKFFEGKDTGVVWFDKEACTQSDNYIALYRKPTIPEV